MATSTVFQFLAFFSGVATLAFGAAASYYLQSEATEADNARQAELSEKTDRIGALQGQVINLQEEAKTELKFQRDMLTGGASFPILVLHPVPGSGNTGLFNGQIWVRGKHPLRDVFVKISVNNGHSTKKIGGTFASIRQSTPTSLGDTFDISGGDINKARITIVYSALNGTFVQTIKFRRAPDGKIQSEIKVIAEGLTRQTLQEVKFGDPLVIGSSEEYGSTVYKAD